jgi:hypothetical protein
LSRVVDGPILAALGGPVSLWKTLVSTIS